VLLLIGLLRTQKVVHNFHEICRRCRPWSNKQSNFVEDLNPGIFLANGNSRSRSLYAIACPSVCRLSFCRQ